MSSHQNYLESPYSVRDTEVAMQEHWEANEAPAEYEFLVETDNIDGIMDDESSLDVPDESLEVGIGHVRCVVALLVVGNIYHSVLLSIGHR